MAERKEIAWWLPKFEGKQRYKRVYDVLGRIRQAQSYQKARFDRWARLYEASFLTNLGVSVFTRPNTMGAGKGGTNVTKSVCDALCADVTAEDPKVSFVTSGGDWDLQQRGMELEKFTDGQAYELGLNEMWPQCELDAFIFGNGFCKFYKSDEASISDKRPSDRGVLYDSDSEKRQLPSDAGDDSDREQDGAVQDAPSEGGEEARQEADADADPEEAKRATRINAERVLPWEMIVDDQEALYGSPRNLYQRKWVDRSVLISEFPEYEQKILAAKTTRDDDDYIGFDTTSDQVLVTEAWHLPTYSGARDGVHCILIQNCTLLDERWDRDYFPFVIFRGQKPIRGWWGPSLVAQLERTQYRLNKLDENIDVSFQYLAAGHWMVDKNSKVNPLKVDNVPGTFIQYTNVKPECVVPNPVSPQVFEHRKTLIGEAYQIASGVSQLSAQSEKPPGLNSGKAIDAYIDVGTKRFANVRKLYHSTRVEAVKQILDLSSDIAAENPDFDVMSADESDSRRINYKKNELRKDEYYLRLYPTNAFSDDPSERMAEVQTMASEGWLDEATAKRLLWDIPDIKRVGDLEAASYNAVESCISQILKHGKYRGPAPFLDLDTGIKQVHNALVMSWQKGAPQARLTMLMEWIQDAQALQAKAAAALQAQQAATMAAANPAGPMPAGAPGQAGVVAPHAGLAQPGAPANATGAGGMNGALRPPVMPAAPSPFQAGAAA